MSAKVRWGLLSTANINRRVIPAIKASTRGELVAVASRDRARGEAYARQWGIPRTYEGYDALLRSEAVDAVYISLPNHLHAELTVAALEAGKAVLCEKPFALSLVEVDRVADAAARTGGVVAEAFMYRHHPQTKIIGAFIQGGRLGRLLSWRATFSFKLANPANVRLVPEYGGGCLWDVGVYPVSFGQFVMGGAPEAVTGSSWIGPSGVDEHFAAQLVYREERIGQFISSFASPQHTEAEILGEGGRLLVTRPFVNLNEPERRVTFYPEAGDPEELPVPEEYLYQGEVEDIHDALLDGRPTHLTLEETRRHVQTVLALYRSAREDRPVALDEVV